MALLTNETNEDIQDKQKIENYRSCQIWLEGYNRHLQKWLTRFTFHYSADIILLTRIV